MIGSVDMTLPNSMGILGATIGIPVVESDLLAYDEMFISATTSQIVVGELAHFRYRLEQYRLNDECRKACREAIEKKATEILGEPWIVGGSV